MGVHVSIKILCISFSRRLRSRNAKPSDSDLEDDSDDEDLDDPSTWLWEDDQDDGIKGQDIVQPDAIEDYSNIIRIDETRSLQYNTFYEPRDND